MPEPNEQAPRRQVSLRPFVRGALVFVGLSALALLALAKLLPDFLSAQTLELSAPHLAGAILLLPVLWTVDAWRYLLMGRGVDLSLRFTRGLQLTFLYQTASILTPGSAGGQPILIWYLMRKGIAVDKAAAVAVLKPLLGMAVITVCGGLGLALHPDPPPGVNAILYPGLALFALVALLLGLLFVRPLVAARLFVWKLSLLARLPLVGPKVAGPKVRDAVDRTVTTIATVQREGWPFLFANLLLTVAWYAVGLTLFGLLVLGVGIERGPAELALDLGLFRALAIYSPTPGAAGIAEGGIAWFFGTGHALALMAAFRVLLFYVPIAVGLGLIGRELVGGTVAPAPGADAGPALPSCEQGTASGTS